MTGTFRYYYKFGKRCLIIEGVNYKRGVRIRNKFQKVRKKAGLNPAKTFVHIEFLT